MFLQRRLPYELYVLQNCEVSILAIVNEEDRRVLIALVHPFFQLHFPFVDGFHNVNCHVPQSAHVDKYWTDDLDWVFDGVVDLDIGVPCLFDVLHVHRVSDVVRAQVWLLEHGENALHFWELAFDFFDAFFPGDEGFLNDLKGIFLRKKFIILEFEIFFNSLKRPT